VPDSVLFVGPIECLDARSSTPERPVLCEVGFLTWPAHSERVIGSLGGGRTTPSVPGGAVGWLGDLMAATGAEVEPVLRGGTGGGASSIELDVLPPQD